MFLSRRATQAEYFDSPGRDAEEIAEGYRLLGRINRFFHFAEPFQRLLPELLGEEMCRNLTILDLGAGDGSLGRKLAAWASEKGWRWKVTNFDLNPAALELNPEGHNVVGSVLDLPFPQNSFDVVIASQMTHHLDTSDEVRQHFSEAWRVARHGILINDLHRSYFFFAVIWFLLRLGKFPPNFRADGLLSVKRSFRVSEWRKLADDAGIENARVWLYFGARITLQARKPV